MSNQRIKHELINILSGKSKIGNGAIIQSIACYLKNGEKPSRNTQNKKQSKKEETKLLIAYIEQHQLWIEQIDFNQYVSEGAEQRVYLKDGDHVIKLNDGIYYLSWKDYFYNLLIHNYFFPDTSYTLNGFTLDNKILYAVVQQKYVSIDSTTDLIKVKRFMQSNGFDLIRNNDYLNPSLGIILEDLHDENVLTKNDILYFIDTVFYLEEHFWKLG